MFIKLFFFSLDQRAFVRPFSLGCAEPSVFHWQCWIACNVDSVLCCVCLLLLLSSMLCFCIWLLVLKNFVCRSPLGVGSLRETFCFPLKCIILHIIDRWVYLSIVSIVFFSFSSLFALFEFLSFFAHCCFHCLIVVGGVDQFVGCFFYCLSMIPLNSVYKSPSHISLFITSAWISALLYLLFDVN